MKGISWMVASLFPLTDIPFSFSCKKHGHRHKALLFSSVRQLFSGFANGQGQFSQAAAFFTAELCWQIALSRTVCNRAPRIIRPLSKVCCSQCESFRWSLWSCSWASAGSFSLKAWFYRRLQQTGWSLWC